MQGEVMTTADDPALDRVHLSHSGATGTHWAWFDEQGRLVVEWYDHGPDAPYESANRLRFDPEAAVALLGIEATAQDEALAALQRTYASWWEVKQSAVERAIHFTSEVDFLP
jgi:hypothetical protein